MSYFDYLSLDGRSIRTFLMVLEEGSVSKAALRLGVTQSAVSHTLDKLRQALGDELFVRAGRGIDATERARALEAPARALLDDLQAMTHGREFDPTSESMSFTIAANNFQRNILFPQLIRETRERDISLSLRFIPSGVPTAAMLREGRCDLIVSPVRPDGNDIFQSRLFDDKLGCCYDSSVWKKPPTARELKTCNFVAVKFLDDSGGGPTHEAIADHQVVVSVENFAEVGAFIEGTDLVSLQPTLMSRMFQKPLTVSPAPFKTEKFAVYMLWHRRHRMDPTHRWLRNEIQKISESIES